MKRSARMLSALLLLALTPPALALEMLDVSPLVSQVDASVVVIHTSDEAPRGGSPGQGGGGEGVGSGALIEIDGEARILTAAHVVGAVDELNVTFSTGDVYRAQVVAFDRIADIALLRTGGVPNGIRPLELSERAPRRGEPVVVIGVPYGLDHSVSVGHVSSIRSVDDEADLRYGIEFVQTDAAINRGNSGGPMIDAQGEIVGVVSRILSASGGFEGIGFAISAATVRDRLLVRGRAYLGADLLMMNAELLGVFNIDAEGGLLIQKVARRSIADRMGIRGGTIPAQLNGRDLLLGGDVIVSFMGIPISLDLRVIDQANQRLVAAPRGSRIEAEVIRRGKRMVLYTSK